MYERSAFDLSLRNVFKPGPWCARFYLKLKGFIIFIRIVGPEDTDDGVFHDTIYDTVLSLENMNIKCYFVVVYRYLTLPGTSYMEAAVNVLCTSVCKALLSWSPMHTWCCCLSPSASLSWVLYAQPRECRVWSTCHGVFALNHLYFEHKTTNCTLTFVSSIEFSNIRLVLSPLGFWNGLFQLCIWAHLLLQMEMLAQNQEWNGKQCRSWWDGSLRTVSSGSTLFIRVYVLVYRTEKVKRLICFFLLELNIHQGSLEF